MFACVSRNYANGLCFLGRWSLVAMALAGGEISYKSLQRFDERDIKTSFFITPRVVTQFHPSAPAVRPASVCRHVA